MDREMEREMDRAETEKRERQKREKKYRRERGERGEIGERRERRERGDRERRESQIDIIFLKQINKPRMEKRISKKKLHIVGRKGKLKLSQQDTLKLMRVKLLQIRKGSWKGKLLYCESMVEG